jgi:hypothetical protein
MMMDDNIEGEFDNNSNTCPDIQPQSMQVGPIVPTSRPNHKRSKNFSDQEDEILVSAWLNISMDPVVGKDQKVGRYWSRIYEYFNEHKPCQSQRTVNSLMHRWETIQKCVNKFCGCLTRIQLRRQSGTTMQDMVINHHAVSHFLSFLVFEPNTCKCFAQVAQSCALYKSEDEHEKGFQFMHCWNKLRLQPKWLGKVDDLAAAKPSNKKQKTTREGDANGTLPYETKESQVQVVENYQLTRPPGKKTAKAALVQEKRKSVIVAIENLWAAKKESDAEKEQKKEERFNKAFALEVDRVNTEKALMEVRKEEIELQKRRDEERIINMDLSGLTEEQQSYYTKLRAKFWTNFLMLR